MPSQPILSFEVRAPAARQHHLPALVPDRRADEPFEAVTCPYQLVLGGPEPRRGGRDDCAQGGQEGVEARGLGADAREGGTRLDTPAKAAGDARDDGGERDLLDDHLADLGEQRAGTGARVLHRRGVVVARVGQREELVGGVLDERSQVGDRRQGERDLRGQLPVQHAGDGIEMAGEVGDRPTRTPPAAGRVAEPLDVGARPDETLDLVEDPCVDVAESRGDRSAQAGGREAGGDTEERVRVEATAGVGVRPGPGCIGLGARMGLAAEVDQSS